MAQNTHQYLPEKYINKNVVAPSDVNSYQYDYRDPGDVFIDEDFSDSIPSTWTTIATAPNPDEQWFGDEGHGNDPPGASVHWRASEEPRDEWLITPTLSLPTTTNTIMFYFDFSTSTYWLVDANSDDLKIFISTDGGTTWDDPIWAEDSTELVEASGVEVPFENFAWYTARIDISQYNGQDIKIGFHYKTVDQDPLPDHIGVSFYLDNVKVLEYYNNNVEIVSIYPAFSGYGFYSQLPARHVNMVEAGENQEVRLSADILNDCLNPQTNVNLNVTITDGSGEIYNETTATGVTLQPMESDSLGLDTLAQQFVFPDQDIDNYTFTFTATQDEVDDNTDNNVRSIITEVSPGTFCRTYDDIFNSSLDITQFGAADGDFIGNMYYLFSDDTVQSVSVNLTSSSTPGITLIAEVYYWNGTEFFCPIQSDEYVVDESELNTWINIPLIEYGDGEDVLEIPDTWPYLQVLAGVRVYFSGNPWAVNAQIFNYHDYQNSSIYYLGADAQWYYTTRVPAVKLHTSPIPGINDLGDNDPLIKVYPNPVSGEVNIDNVEGADIFIYDLLGKQVASVNNADKFNTIDMSGMAEGTYIIKIQTDKYITTKQVNLVK